MSALLWQVVDRSMLVLYRQLNLVDVEIESDAETALDETSVEAPDWVVAGEGWLACLCGDDGTPVVTMEAWDGPPPAARGWSRTTELETSFPSGRLALSSITTGESAGPIMQLPPSDDETFRVRVQVSPDPVTEELGIAREHEAAGSGSGLTERWLFQFWAVTSA